MQKGQLATNNVNIKTVVKTVVKTYKTKHIISTKKCKYKYKTRHANITMVNLQIQMGVM